MVRSYASPRCTCNFTSCFIFGTLKKFSDQIIWPLYRPNYLVWGRLKINKLVVSLRFGLLIFFRLENYFQIYRKNFNFSQNLLIFT